MFSTTPNNTFDELLLVVARCSLEKYVDETVSHLRKKKRTFDEQPTARA
jgi:hypothetical protein